MPELLVLNHTQVEQLLPMAECIQLMAKTLVALSQGEMVQPLRTVIRPSEKSGLMALMPAVRLGETPSYGVKTICVFPENSKKGKDAHQGGVLLFSGETGELLALVNASAVTAIRTAAVSGVATQILSREDAGELAIIGAGVQARSHLEAMVNVRRINAVRVASRSRERAERFATEAASQYSFPITVADGVEEAVVGADIIVTATTSREPVLRREWISAGAHINAVGTFSTTAREIDTATMRGSSLFVDRRESTLNEAGDYLLAMKEGAIGPEHIKAELGEVLTGALPGRQSKEEITLFKSLGLAVEDLAAAEYVFKQARRHKVGTWVDF